MEPVTLFIKQVRRMNRICSGPHALGETEVVKMMMRKVQPPGLAEMVAIRHPTEMSRLYEILIQEAERLEAAVAVTAGLYGNRKGTTYDVESGSRPKLNEPKPPLQQTKRPIICFKCGKAGHKSPECRDGGTDTKWHRPGPRLQRSEIRDSAKSVKDAEGTSPHVDICLCAHEGDVIARMSLDTGASLSLINRVTYAKLLAKGSKRCVTRL